MKNLFDLTGKTALITGASSGMGKAIAEAMGVQGAKIVVSSNDTEGGKKRLALTPLRRVGSVEEIAGVAVMLASKAGGFMTGQNIIVDGGTTISDGN